MVECICKICTRVLQRDVPGRHEGGINVVVFGAVKVISMKPSVSYRALWGSRKRRYLSDVV